VSLRQITSTLVSLILVEKDCMIAAVSRQNTKSTTIRDVVLTMLLMVHLEFITLPFTIKRSSTELRDDR
jgi:hypothetical protein